MKLADPKVTYSVAQNMWRLEEAYFFEVDDFGFVIAPGFLFDLASVPRVAWFFIAPYELSIAAPLIHDYLTHFQGQPEWLRAGKRAAVSRKEADGYFRDAMVTEQVPAWRRVVAHPAVRAFGWVAWRRGQGAQPPHPSETQEER